VIVAEKLHRREFPPLDGIIGKRGGGIVRTTGLKEEV
jgi:hypothetical protein